jgi:hypothetical protein
MINELAFPRKEGKPALLVETYASVLYTGFENGYEKLPPASIGAYTLTPS